MPQLAFVAWGQRLVLDSIIPKRAVSRVWRAPSIFFLLLAPVVSVERSSRTCTSVSSYRRGAQRAVVAISYSYMYKLSHVVGCQRRAPAGSLATRPCVTLVVSSGSSVRAYTATNPTRTCIHTAGIGRSPAASPARAWALGNEELRVPRAGTLTQHINAAGSSLPCPTHQFP